MLKKIAAAIFCTVFVAAFIQSAWGAEKKSATVSPLEKSLEELKKDISSYFIPVSGKVISVDREMVTINKGSSSSIKKGMRITAFREGAPFRHPVTKEYLGKMEIPAGVIEIISVADSSSKGRILSGKAADFEGLNIKIPANKIRLLFYQGNADWNLADSYYRMLLDSGRFELIDTGLQTATDAELIAEAKKKGAETLVALHSKELKNTVELTQKIYWVNDSRQFSEATSTIALASIKQLKFSAGAFAWKKGEALLKYKLPFSASRMAVGDFKGTGQPDVVFASDNRVGIYKLDVELKPLWEFKTSGPGDILWIDTLDVNGDGRDEILITTASGTRSNLEAYSTSEIYQAGKSGDSAGSVRSFIYALDKDNTFKPIWRGENIFIRSLEKKVVGQQFSSSEGFDGRLFPIEYNNGRFTTGQPMQITRGLNIYDFQYVYAPDGRRGYFAWDDNGFVNFYNDKGVRTWVSKEEFGGFADSFKKESGNVMLDKGSWAMKDKFVLANAEVLAPKRKPMFGLVSIKSLGYSSSELRSFWWNGITIEERSYLEEVDGTILDYISVGDRLLVLIKPYLISLDAINTLFKGENPLGIMLYMFSTKGR
jgi:hypothetical protein